MAKKPSKRWEKLATKAATDGWSGDAWAVSIADTATLLQRQHAAFVRLVKMRTITDVEGDWDKGYNMAIKDILAALQQGGKP